MDPSHRSAFDRTLARYADLGRSLGKFVWVVAAAPCTHAPEGSGWGAVDAVAGGLWYADLLGRAATRRRPHEPGAFNTCRPRLVDGVGVTRRPTTQAAGGARLVARQTLVGGVYGLLDSRTYAETPSAVVARVLSLIHI